MALGIVNMPVDAVAISHLDDVSSATAVASSKLVTITWTDPEDLYYDGATVAKWAGTLLVRKEGSAPKSRFDGDIIVDSTTRNQYASTGFADTNVVNGTIYYYKFFPYDITGNYRPGTSLDAQPAAISVPLPTVTGAFTYNGSSKSPTLTYDSEAVNVSGDIDGTNVGTYTITFSLKSDYYVWADGTYTSKPRTWTISPEEVTKPTIKTGQTSLVYNGNFQSPELDNFVAAKMTQGGQDSRMTVGNYNMSITLSSTNYIWEGEDETIREITLPWSITKAANTITLSATSGNVVYGEYITFTVTGNESNGELSVSVDDANAPYVDVEITGSTVTVTSTAFKSSNIAVTVSSASTSNYESGSVIFTVIPQKAAGSLTLSSNSATLNNTTPNATITATRAGDGLIQVSSSDNNIATTTVNSNGIITITGIATGNATITVSVLAGSNHYAPADATIAVSCDFFPTKQSFNDTSWADIATVVKAGRASEYWNVGDTKDMQFPAAITMDSGTIPANTTYKVVILGFDHNSATEGTNRLHLCIGKNGDGTKDICFEAKQMKSEYSNSGGWDGCAMKTWLNGIFYNALPSDLQAVITACIKYTDNHGKPSNASNYVTATSQKIWLLAEYEVFGSRTYANQYEQNSQAQYDYYKNGNSKVRYGHSGGSALGWWLRSPYSNGGSSGFCNVNDSGEFRGSYAPTTFGVVPCFTIS